jgi:predicted enzyme related to lactoylglutathione lyase
LGWKFNVASDTDQMRYSVGVNGDNEVAGIMDAGSMLPEGVPSHWQVYFGSDELDAALIVLEELGGKILRHAQDTPYGRMAQVQDPMGAVFKMISAAQE